MLADVMPYDKLLAYFWHQHISYAFQMIEIRTFAFLLFDRLHKATSPLQ